MKKLLTVIFIFAASTICKAEPVFVKNQDGSFSEIVPIDPIERKAELQQGIDEDTLQILECQKRIGIYESNLNQVKLECQEKQLDLQSDIDAKRSKILSLQTTENQP